MPSTTASNIGLILAGCVGLLGVIGTNLYAPGALIETAKRPTTPSDFTNSIGMEFQLIPAGSFRMGSPAGEPGRDDDEHQHRVAITQDYYLGKFEVTQSEWKSVMGTEPWKGPKGDLMGDGYGFRVGDDYPAVHIDWEDAVEFCRKLSKVEGKNYRLPTEAEWEYACRGATVTVYSFGSDSSELGRYGWYVENASDVGENYAHLVGQKRGNGFGLHDMHGNVEEWCSDWKGEGYYIELPREDPAGPDVGSDRVFRGGGWGSGPQGCRSAKRGRLSPDVRNSGLGFRVLRSSDGGSLVADNPPNIAPMPRLQETDMGGFDTKALGESMNEITDGFKDISVDNVDGLANRVTDFTGSLDGIGMRIEDLPSPAKKAVGEMFGSFLDSIDKAMGAVSDDGILFVLKPVIGSMKEKIAGFRF